MSMTDQAAVKDYIAKYQLEDELSADKQPSLNDLR